MRIVYDIVIILLILLLAVSILQYQDTVKEDYELLQYEIKILKQQLTELEEWIDQWDIGGFEATAYTLECGNGDGYTATMTIPRKGVIAVDPDVIPLSTEVYIDGLGWYKAEDTGGLIKGEIIDIYMDNIEDAYEWGRRNVKLMYRGK